MRKKTTLQELVHPPYDFPEVLVKRAINEIENKSPFYRYIIFEISTGGTYVRLSLEVFGEGLLEEAHLTWAANDLREELHKLNKLYLLLRDVYGLEPKRASWWSRLWSTPPPELY